ncbi:MAG: hypothetical protein V4650_00555 [Pseudomonadota bacterium]
MGALLARLQATPQALWLDSHAYCARLLAGGSAPWLDVGNCVGWQRKAQGLLKADVLALPVADIIDAWLAAHPNLRTDMAAKARATYPLRTLLADEALRAHLVELVLGLRAGLAGLPLVLVLPAPRAWVLMAYAQAHGTATEAGEDEADSASVYIADFLRVFGEAGVEALLLQAAEDAAGCQSLLNVAAHYRWDVGVQGASSAPPAGTAFVIAAQALQGLTTGIALDQAFWNGEAANPQGAFVYAHIPVAAQPEAVLDRLATLR